MRAGLRPDRCTARAGFADHITAFGGGNVKDHHRLIQIFGKAAHAFDGLNLCHPGAGPSVITGCSLACINEVLAGLRNDRVIFGMDTDQRAMPLGLGHDGQDFGVAELNVVGGKDLDRPVARANQPFQITFKIRHARVRHGHMKRIVDHGPTGGARCIIGHRVRKGLACILRCKGDHAGRAPHRGRACRRLERVCVPLAHARHLFDMGVGIDATGQDKHAAGINVVLGAVDRVTNRYDLPVHHGHIAGHDAPRCHNRAIAYHQINLGCHLCLSNCHLCRHSFA
mmetsp:Transcript_7172/g.11836  ORF Transcript_7172/g.11836 Transcript_7172/m.11836 type:complete len:283 (+) Transcript_7172:1023-1871(+)